MIEIAIGKLSNRKHYIEKSHLTRYLKPKQELYKSYFSFDESILEHIKSGRKTPSGYIGNFYLDQLIIDVDANSPIDIMEKLRITVNRLIADFNVENNLQVWFSGTGFHIHLPNIFNFQPSSDLPLIVRNTIVKHIPEADTKPINARGLIRVGYSYNNKSKLYKTPIKLDDIWFSSYEQIAEKATEQDFTIKPIKFTPLKKTFEHLIIKEDIDNNSTVLKAPSHEATNVVTCMQTCFNAGAVEGTRHERMLRLISWQQRNGTPLEAVIAMMETYAPKINKYEIKKLVTDIFKKDYPFSCHDIIMKQFCKPNCIFYKNKGYTSEIITVKDLENSLHIFSKGNWQSTAVNLKEDFELTKDFYLIPGDLVSFVGGTGLNKTSIVQNIVNKHKKKTLYMSTEFSLNLLYRRFCQIEYGMTKEEVLEHYKKHNNTLGTNLSYNHFLRTATNSTKIVSIIKKMSYEVVVIDVIDDIVHPNYPNNGISSQEAIAPQLKLAAEETKSIIILVHHISKSAAFDKDGYPKELTIHSGKGSSAYEQKSDVVIGVQGIQTDTDRTVRSLKARDFPPFRRRIIIDTNTFQYNMEKNDE